MRDSHIYVMSSNWLVIRNTQTQNSAYVYLNNNVTTPWNFRSYKAQPTHVFINLGTNDDYFHYNGTAFSDVRSFLEVWDICWRLFQTYITFLHNLRAVYPSQPIFIMSPWGYVSPAGVRPYYNAEDAAAIAGVHDANVHLINGTGWIQYGDAFPEYVRAAPRDMCKHWLCT
jgi:hypothetical protein